jgi:hypothetical protein
MLKSILKLNSLGLLALAIAAAPFQAQAQSTNKPSADKKPAVEKKDTAKAEKKQTSGPFKGKLAALDQSAKTITVGKRTFHITSDTKVFKDGKPAMLSEGVVNEEVSGGFKTAEDGRLVATKVTFGPVAGGKSAERKKDTAEKKKDTTEKK